MKYNLKTQINIVTFLRTVDLCEETVLFESQDGDHLDLKSQLCKYMFLTVGLDSQYLKSCWISCSASDATRLSDFIVIPKLKKERDYN